MSDNMDLLANLRNATVSIVLAIIVVVVSIQSSIEIAFGVVVFIIAYLVVGVRDDLDEMMTHIERMRTTQLLTIYEDGYTEGDDD